MTFGVFVHRSDSIYDDSPAERYQFPRKYLERARACVGDWIVYYEPRKVIDTRGYFAVARVQDVVADPKASHMYLAVIEPGTYLEFVEPVSFHGAGGVVERGLLNGSGRLSGWAQAAIRPLGQHDFVSIVGQGLAEDVAVLDRVATRSPNSGFCEQQEPFAFDLSDERERTLSSRVLRDRVFRRVVLRAYGERCAVSGLKLINGGGRAEVAAAHIRPVHAQGPDIVNNGLALSGTAHWMFDRGLISLADDLSILISRQVNDADGIRSFLTRDGRALVPGRIADRPHPHFLRWHREHCFKQ